MLLIGVKVAKLSQAAMQAMKTLQDKNFRKFFGFEMPTAFDVPKYSLWAVPIKPSHFLEPKTLMAT